MWERFGLVCLLVIPWAFAIVIGVAYIRVICDGFSDTGWRFVAVPATVAAVVAAWGCLAFVYWLFAHPVAP
jgi:hypothetical protein